MTGDTAGAEESLARARAVAAALDFPQGAWSTAYADWLASWLWIETGELDRAEEAVAALGTASARHGFDGWEVIAATQTVTVERSAGPPIAGRARGGDDGQHHGLGGGSGCGSSCRST